ncbi:MAG: response regulator [Bdellovibrionales bacterium]|nr:response regulator [Bdellovibrionales bacterium]
MVKPTESPVKILLADDSVTMHRAVALALKKLPWHLVTCDNGQDALRLTLEQKPDVVIADLDMPGLTGAELCHAIRAKPALASTKVILLCGSFEQVDEAQLDKIPADGRLWKPFESHVLTALIDALLKTQHAREGADPTQGAPLVRESAERTMPAEKTAEPLAMSTDASPTGDIMRAMTEETFRPSSIKERILPEANEPLSADKVAENLWSPDMSFEEEFQDEPGVSSSTRESAAPTAPGAARPEDFEFSVFRDGQPSPGNIDLTPPGGTAVPLEIEVPPRESPAPTLPPHVPNPQAWIDEMHANAAAAAGPGMDEESMRKIVREEIDIAFRGWMKEELQKVLAQVISDIDHA